MANRTEARQKLRRDNFAKLKKERFKSSVALADALGDGFSTSYISQLLNGHRGIGDDVADKIEKRLDLKKGYLDDSGAGNANQAEWDKIVWLWEHADDEVRMMLSLLTVALYDKKRRAFDRKERDELNAGAGNSDTGAELDAGGTERIDEIPANDH